MNNGSIFKRAVEPMPVKAHQSSPSKGDGPYKKILKNVSL